MRKYTKDDYDAILKFCEEYDLPIREKSYYDDCDNEVAKALILEKWEIDIEEVD